MEYNKYIKAIIGAESILLILPKEAENKLNIADQEWLTFEVRNKELVIKKIADVERSLKTNDLKDDGIGVAVA
jgi:hypothetical protein